MICGMSARPVIFISAVSRELRSARDVVAKTLTFLGYDPDWQDIFGTEEGDIKQVLRRHIDASAGLIQIIGQCYGLEPPQPDSEFGRVSYTQYEALYARKRGKKVWLILLEQEFPTDPHNPEPKKLSKLQSEYRKRIHADTKLRHTVANNVELQNCIHGLRKDLERLRRHWRRLVIAVLILLLVLVVFSVVFGFWHIRAEATLKEIDSNTDKIGLNVQKLDSKIDNQSSSTAALTEAYIKRFALSSILGDQEIEKSRLNRMYAILNVEQHLPAGTLEKELPKLTERVLLGNHSSQSEIHAWKLIEQNKPAEAEAVALESKGKLLSAGSDIITHIYMGYLLAASAAERQHSYKRTLDYLRVAEALCSQENYFGWAMLQRWISQTLGRLGEYDQAVNLLRPVVESLKKKPELAIPFVMDFRRPLAANLLLSGKFSEAESEWREIIVIEDKNLNPDDPQKFYSYLGLACCLSTLGKNTEAVFYARLASNGFRKKFGDSHKESLLAKKFVDDLERKELDSLFRTQPLF